ncbi:TonB-dependent receptor [Jiulongibacter sediminis]|uniref:TonB-dependent receptor n=1 Tax=Jiulongibacter sediminis TaxID=1605367 RepID=UPI0026EFA616|nr:TonB-dependent receptor [Jiulongibacter sediminis]
MRGVIAGIILLFIQQVQGQQPTVTITGKINNSSGEPMSFASVSIRGLNLAALSNDKGVFSLKNVPTGRHTVEVNYVGFAGQAKTVEVKTNSASLKVDFELSEEAGDLKEVLVRGKSEETKIETQGFAVNVVKTKEAGLRNIQTNELLNTTVGVKIRQNGGLGSDVQYSLNGLSGSSVRIFIDGIPISIYGSSFNLNSIPPAMIKNIEVYKGVVPGHLADDALGGAINIVLHKSARTNFNTSASYSSFNTFQTNVNGLYRFQNSGFTVKASAFHNYSDNDYKVSGRSVVVTGLGGVQTPITARRFNDAYRSSGGMFQLGFTDVKWADQLYLGVTGADDYKEVQHGAFMTIIPYFGRYVESQALLSTLTYQKRDLVKGLDLNINGTYGKRDRYVSDTVAAAYSWSGERAIDFRGNVFEYVWRSQQEGGPTLLNIDRNVASIRSGLSYRINRNHKLLLNHVYSGIDREDSDALISLLESTFVGTRDLSKNIYSLTYELSAFNERLKTSLFGKYYQQETTSVDPAIEQGPDGKRIIVDEVMSSNKTYDGYGFALSYMINKNFTLLTSAEKAVRLPNETEIFGDDGDNVIANSSIKPELSNNFNFGFRLGTFNLKRHQVTVSTNLFARNIKDRIGLPIETSLNVDDELILYVNQGSGTSKGIDAQLNYTYNRNLSFNFNISRFDLKVESRGVEVDVPNTPFFTMNAALRYSIKDFIQDKSRLNLFYTAYFTDEFSYVTAQGANTVGNEFFNVPRQLSQDLGLSYMFPENRVVLSFDIKNIFNQPVYDNLSVQKPGRAFYVKLNYSINKF